MFDVPTRKRGARFGDLAFRLLIDRAGKLGTDHSIEAAIELPAIFEFVCHLSIKQRESAQDVLRLRIVLVACPGLDVRGAFEKSLLLKTEIHGQPIRIIKFTNANALAERRFRKIPGAPLRPGIITASV